MLRLEAGWVMLFLVACSTGATPSGPREQEHFGKAPANNSLAAQPATELPLWILEPRALPDGWVGKNNCTFPFGQNVPQWDFHPDAGCWERAGLDGWTRQQFESIHIPSFPSCGGGLGDANVIRVCRAGGPGQPSPCTIDPLTGPNGCARCVINPTCH
jgi:hypothetical protein